MNWTVQWTEKLSLQDWYIFRVTLDIKQYNLLFLWLNYTRVALKLLGQFYLGNCSHLLAAVLHMMFPSEWICHVPIPKFCASMLVCWLVAESIEHIDKNISMNPQAVDYLSKQTIALTPSYVPTTKWCGSVGARRSRTYFWIFVWFFCLSVCWGVFCAEVTGLPGLLPFTASLIFSAILRPNCLPSLLYNLHPSLRCNSSQYMGFIWQLDGAMFSINIGHVFLIGAQCFLLSLVEWRFCVTFGGQVFLFSA